MPFEKYTSGSDKRYPNAGDPYENYLAQSPDFPFMTAPSSQGGAGKYSSNVGNFLFENLANLIGGVKYGEMKTAPQVTMAARPGKKTKKGTEAEAISDMEQLFQQLLGMVGASGGVDIDYESALRDSEAAIRAAYANDIRAIRQGNKAARKDTAKARRMTERDYRKLAKSYRKSGKTAMRQGDKLAEMMQANASESANFVQQNSDQMLQEQAALAQGLGIEDALPAATAPLTEETQDIFNAIVQEGSEDANRQLGFAGNQQRFMERGRMGSKMEGTNRSNNLLNDLQNFLQDSRARIAGLKGDRGRELAANEQATMQSVAEMQSAAEADQWDRLMQLADLKMGIEKEQFDQSSNLRDYQLKLAAERAGGRERSQDEGLPGLPGLSDAQKYLEQLQRPRRGAGVFDSFLNSQAMTTGNYYDDTAKREFKMTPEAAAKMIEQVAREQNMSQEDQNLLRLAILAYME